MNWKTVLLATFSLFVSISVHAQKNGKLSIENTIEDFRIAMINADSAKLSLLVSDKLSYGHSSGAIDDKKTFINKLVSGQSDFVSIDLSEQTIMINKGVAVVRHILKAKTNDSGKPGEVNLRILLIWQKENKSWKLLARQALRI